ncbi:hypothetical protein CAEBREN_14360 [Caenorhabditis brenneri]|uniref:Uncharacterized protein n=1 Tax=Caenorhabditis brenneri TaxID=135651 RepID=G0PMD1_CAEBE|nr:hypothetical protein CAEBREN_14360 [Caenorhabditis brenneri]
MDVARRENYLYNNKRFFEWFAAVAEGSVEERDADPDMKTNRCPACASSFFGFPLRDHKYQDCGFVNFVAAERVLQLLVANTHSFCGGCNSRSTHHYSCKPKDCNGCFNAGHKIFHNVCYTEWGQSPEAFKGRCHELRIQHLERVRFGINAGRIAIPSPNDFVPPRIGRLLNPDKQIQGVGPLIGNAARHFGPIRDDVYQWKRYRGLVAVDSDPENVIRPSSFSNEEARIFMKLEYAARTIYASKANDPGRQHHIFTRCFHLLFPDYPEGMANPGKPNNLPIAAPANALPPAAIPQNEVQEVEAQADVNDEQGNASSDDSVRESDEEVQDNVDDEQADVPQPVVKVATDEEIAALTEFVRNATLIDNATNGALRNVIKREPNFAQTVATLSRSCDPDENGEYPLLEDVDASEVSTYFEERLQQIVKKSMTKWSVEIDGEIASYNVPSEVVDVIIDQRVPESTCDLVMRIDTWLTVLTGAPNEAKDWYHKVPDNRLRRYLFFLSTIATSLKNSSMCFKQKQHSTEGDVMRDIQVIQEIPSVRDFDKKSVEDRVNQWIESAKEQFALFRVNQESFPINENVKQLAAGAIAKTEQEELQVQRTLERAVSQSDMEPSVCQMRVQLPSAITIDYMIAVEDPKLQAPLLRRVGMIQDVMTGVHERHLAGEDINGLQEYLALWRAILKPIKVLVELGLSAPTRLAHCHHDMIQGASRSHVLALPSYAAFKNATHGFWKTWIKECLIPQIGRIAATACDCEE